MLRRSCKILREERNEMRRRARGAEDLNEILLRENAKHKQEIARLRQEVAKLRKSSNITSE